MTQEAFWRHDDERFAPGPQCLAPQTMEVLGRSTWINHLQVVIRGEVEKPFQSRAGMFRSLPFVTMRQEQDQPAQSAPLILGAGNALIHDRLGGVPEIPILPLP